MTLTRLHKIAADLAEQTNQTIATAYNQAGERYEAYADGEAQELDAFDGRHAYGDQRVWAILDRKLRGLRLAGASLRILDLGCGPGTWLCRVVARARAIGFTSITAIGVDLAETQVRRARTRSRDLAELEGVELTFETGDICERLPWSDASFDLCLCLYGVLNHIPPSRVSEVFAEIARVDRGDLIATVRSVGSTPTICVDSIEEARWFWRDERRNRLEAELQNGRRLSMDFRLFGTAELRAASSPHFNLTELQGLDLFHGRFSGDRRWNSASRTSASFIRELESLEERYCRDPEFVDHANHLLFIASPRPSPRAKTGR